MSIGQKLAAARRLGGRAVVRTLVDRARAALWTNETLVIFEMRPHELVPITPTLPAGASWRAESAPATPPAAGETLPANMSAELVTARPRQRVHLIRVGGEIASWGFSALPDEPWPLTETRSVLPVVDGGVCLTAFETLPPYRGQRLYPALLTHILQERFREGCPVAYIWCRESNRASYAAIKRVGFAETATHRFRRVLGVARAERVPAAG